MFWMKDIEWVRALTRRSQIKQRKRNIKRNYKKVYCDIKSRAKMGFNTVSIRYSIYDQNVRRSYLSFFLFVVSLLYWFVR